MTVVQPSKHTDARFDFDAARAEEGPVPRPGRGPSRRRTWLRMAAGALAVLVLAEVVARVVGPSLPVGGYEERTNFHLTQLAARDRPLDVLVAGASEAGAGVDPLVLAERSAAAGPTYNFWMAAAPMRSIAATVEHVILPRHTPRVLVVGVTSREFNRSGAQQDLVDETMARMSGYRLDTGTASWLGRLEETAGSLSAVVRYRHQLRSPSNLVRYRAPLSAQQEAGMLTDRQPLERYEEREGHLDQERRALANFELNPEDVGALARLTDVARAEGVEVVVVEMPVYERHYFALHAGLAEADASYRAAIAELAAAKGVPYLDARAALDWDDPALWGDVNHLNRKGSLRLTGWLADQLDGLTRAG